MKIPPIHEKPPAVFSFEKGRALICAHCCFAKAGAGSPLPLVGGRIEVNDMSLEIKNDRTVLNDDAIREVTLPDMLEARDRRVWRQQELRDRYPGLTMVCFTMNIAGPVKNSPLIRRGFLYGCSQIRQQLMRIRKRAEYEVLFDEFTGNEGYFMIALPPLEVKRMTVEVEDGEPVGRLFDMDVLDPDGRKLDRTELNADRSPDSGSHSVSAAGRIRPRTCLLCGRPAKECARNRTHTVGQLQEKTMQVLTGFVRERDLQTIARDACRALLYEVCTTPKPGLVDRVNTGSHRDMDIFTFMDSAAALQPYFRRCGEIGMATRDASPEETFRQIRQAGVAAERDMLEVTHGVNTHKGAVFSVGIACAALGRLDHSLWKDPASVLAECGRIAAGIASRDFAKLAASTNAAERADSAAAEVPAPADTPLTAGEKLYLSQTFDTNGKLREARRLHSMTLRSRSEERNWMLKGPVIWSSEAIAAAVFRIRESTDPYTRCAGNCMVASPEWTPANSICSEMAQARTRPPSATASHSSSWHRWRKALTTTGCSAETSAARSRQEVRSVAV